MVGDQQRLHSQFHPSKIFISVCILQAGNFCRILYGDLYTSESSWHVVVGHFLCDCVEALNMDNKISSSSQEKPTVSITDVMCVALSSVWAVILADVLVFSFMDVKNLMYCSLTSGVFNLAENHLRRFFRNSSSKNENPVTYPCHSKPIWRISLEHKSRNVA